MKTPLIGISGSIMRDGGGMFPGYARSYVNDDYVQSVSKSGGIPVILPFNENDTQVRELVSKLDGLVLSGGHDLYPLNYGEEPLQGIGDVWPERDHYDFLLLEAAKEKGIPVLAICRGHQIVNVFYGGTLYQDLKYDKNCTLKHSQNQRPGLATHTVTITEGSRFAQIVGKTEVLTNSHHHQTVKAVGQGLTVTAVAKDGTIEALEDSAYPYLVSYQFHPEMMFHTDENAKKIFADFIAHASK